MSTLTPPMLCMAAPSCIVVHMSTAANPVTAVKLARVVHTASNNRVSWVGLRVVLVHKDGTREQCAHAHGHRSEDTARKCATKLVAQRNKACCTCMTEDPGDGHGERVVTHSGTCPQNPDR